MADRTALTTATKQELENARTKGQVIGWIQGAGAVIAVGVALKFLGWIPVLLIGGAVVYLGYKLLSGGKSK
jgi:hypothetical protein